LTVSSCAGEIGANQALANCQSRLTVREEAFNASAASFPLKPLKKRNPTTLA